MEMVERVGRSRSAGASHSAITQRARRARSARGERAACSRGHHSRRGMCVRAGYVVVDRGLAAARFACSFVRSRKPVSSPETRMIWSGHRSTGLPFLATGDLSPIVGRGWDSTASASASLGLRVRLRCSDTIANRLFVYEPNKVKSGDYHKVIVWVVKKEDNIKRASEVMHVREKIRILLLRHISTMVKPWVKQIAGAGMMSGDLAR